MIFPPLFIKNKTIKHLIKDAIAKGLNKYDAYYIMSHILQREKEFIFVNPYHRLNILEYIKWMISVKKRLRGVPASYITKYREFYSINFFVKRGVLIPRPETEILIEEVINCKPSSLLDIGTGSGNIAIAVKRLIPDCRVTAVDISSRALRIARKNCINILGELSIEFIKSDLCSSLKDRIFDVIVSNPPYISSGEIDNLQVEVAKYEPRIALDGGEDGLLFYRRIISECSEFLNEDGIFIFEISDEIYAGIVRLAKLFGFKVKRIRKDYSGLPRVLILGR